MLKLPPGLSEVPARLGAEVTSRTVCPGKNIILEGLGVGCVWMNMLRLCCPKAPGNHEQELDMLVRAYDTCSEAEGYELCSICCHTCESIVLSPIADVAV